MNKNRAIRWLTFAVLLISLSGASFAQVLVSVRFGPPALPVYAQPVCPGSGYFWTPGYWAWDDAGGYYWVPGTWVLAPVGLLWTPGYWGWNDGAYAWNAGYWGPTIGFYGGINYGFGYTGAGFFGGEWRGGTFFYNRSVMNINVTNVTNVYEKTVIVNNNHFAFNGPGGVSARPTPEQERYAHEQHTAPLPAQTEHQHAASQNRALFASENHGRPSIAATGKPGEFSGHDVVAAKAAGAAYHAPKMSPRQARVASGEKSGAENRGTENRGAEKGGAGNHAAPAKENQARENKAEPARQQKAASTERQPAHATKTEQPKAAREPQEPRESKAAQPKHQAAPARQPAAHEEQPKAPKQAAPKEQAPKPQAKPARTESKPPAQKKEPEPKK